MDLGVALVSQAYLSFLCICCMVEYIEETPPLVLVPIYAMEIKFIHTCIYYGGVCSMYSTCFVL